MNDDRMVKVNITMTERMHEDLKVAAARRARLGLFGANVSELIRLFAAQFLNEWNRSNAKDA